MTDNFEQSIQQAIAERDMYGLIQIIPYARLIGLDCLTIGDSFIFKLPKNEDNLGNPTLPAIHGGVMGGFMETAGNLHVMMTTESATVPKVVDFSIDYLSPGRHRDTYAQCNVVRQGRKIANVMVTSAHARDDKNQIKGINWDKPIAVARMNMLIVS